ncbi:hypothetical protein C7M84_006079 [Penaeus vannamei]|uniref:Uncharacterized protein n=1 Tax=Penaeus vannamei TaxID=6689 RepID=A0A3R7PFU5_PENVA|nr:hypothetical protein C7M84_006079 [Penaeus vannamei]
MYPPTPAPLEATQSSRLDLLLDDEVLVDKASDDVNAGDPKMARLKAVSEEPAPTQASTETPHYKPISPDTVYININRSFESWAEAKTLAELIMREADWPETTWANSGECSRRESGEWKGSPRET